MIHMKVLSIKEPFASLIAKGIKKIETRSFKTNYRGELYIHASLREDPIREELNNLVKNLNFNRGYILCKCRLVDCVYMSEEYINNLKENNYTEYICGRYEVGRYAWVLDDIEVLDNLVKVKGQLGIWNYFSEDEIMDFMMNIRYGWVDKYNNIHEKDYETFSSEYKLQSPKELIKNKIGVCYDQVELERYYFNGHYFKTYFIVYYNGVCPSHTFLVYEKNNKYYWFEHSWELCRGIHEFNNLNDLLKSVRDKFVILELNNKYEKEKVVLHEYNKPKYNIGVNEFFNHCDKGRYIELWK